MPIEVKEKAISLRKKGYSLKEISLKLKISKSTASGWLSNIDLDDKARFRLKNRGILGQYKSIIVKRKKRLKLLATFKLGAKEEIKRTTKTKEFYRIMAAVMFWCEGNKDFNGGVRFTNSDPEMIGTFMRFLRKGFTIDERKFRALVHLHEYHDKQKQLEFWSRVTKLPLTQFNRSYLKPHTGKRIKEGYQGCVAIYYNDVSVSRMLWAYYLAIQKYF